MWNYYKTVVVNSDVAEDGNKMFMVTEGDNKVEVFDVLQRKMVPAVNV